MTELEIDSDRLLGHIFELSDHIGARLAGSEPDAKARAYIASVFKESGLDVEEQIFRILSGEVSEYSLAVLDPPLGEVRCAPFYLAGTTDGEQCESEIAWLEPGAEPGDIAGRIVFWRLANRNDLLFRYADIVAKRPLAIIVIWATHGAAPKFQRVPEGLARMDVAPPSLVLRKEEADKLERLKARRAAVRLISRCFEAECANVVAKAANSSAEKKIVIGAHYDTAPGTPGALDNAAGVAVVLELARLWGARPEGALISFACWGAEKAGMIGSRTYLERLTARARDELGLCMCFDGIGARDGRSVCYVSGGPALQDQAKMAAAGVANTIETHSGFYGSDSEMFVQFGVPALSFGQEGPHMVLLHTAGDNSQRVDKESLGQFVHFANVFLKSVLQAEAWPVERRVEDSISAEARRNLHRMGWV